jgi:ATP-binding cassette subfamily B (MDR/TAP) protein 1
MESRLDIEQFPKTQKEIEDMERVPYISVLGSLMYVMVCTRPYIAHAVGVLRRYISTPGKENWTVVKRVFSYLCGIKYYDICYQGKLGDESKVYVHGFVDADWDRDMDP